MRKQLDIDMMPIPVQNVAMLYYNLFFVKRSYMNYDREAVMNACILLSAKVNSLHELDAKFLVNNHV